MQEEVLEVQLTRMGLVQLEQKSKMHENPERKGSSSWFWNWGSLKSRIFAVLKLCMCFTAGES